MPSYQHGNLTDMNIKEVVITHHFSFLDWWKNKSLYPCVCGSQHLDRNNEVSVIADRSLFRELGM